MKQSAQTFGFVFDRHDARNRLHAATFHLDALSKIRLLLSRSGTFAIETRPLAEASEWRVAVAPLPVSPADFRLCHKTSDRSFYDDARRNCATDEVLFTLPDGRLTEGSISALFVERDGRLLTPSPELGLLPSVLGRELVGAGKAEYADLRAEDLEHGFYMGNSVRGLVPCRRVA
jgi:para-aminobenzoate synthetase / 4-amino-4-deoxychorismate lyase